MVLLESPLGPGGPGWPEPSDMQPLKAAINTATANNSRCLMKFSPSITEIPDKTTIKTVRNALEFPFIFVGASRTNGLIYFNADAI